MARRRRKRAVELPEPKSSPSIDLEDTINYLCSKRANEITGFRDRCAERLSELGSAPDDSKDLIVASTERATTNESGVWTFINKANHTQIETLQTLHAVITRQMKYSGLL